MTQVIKLLEQVKERNLEVDISFNSLLSEDDFGLIFPYASLISVKKLIIHNPLTTGGTLTEHIDSDSLSNFKSIDEMIVYCNDEQKILKFLAYGPVVAKYILFIELSRF